MEPSPESFKAGIATGLSIARIELLRLLKLGPAGEAMPGYLRWLAEARDNAILPRPGLGSQVQPTHP